MAKTGRAFFVDFPRRIEDLTVPHDVNAEREYEIAAKVSLGTVDYENFITDMTADREFIENNCAKCGVGAVWSCLLVQRCGADDGGLVLPTDRRYVKYAAYYRP